MLRFLAYSIFGGPKLATAKLTANASSNLVNLKEGIFAKFSLRDFLLPDVQKYELEQLQKQRLALMHRCKELTAKQRSMQHMMADLSRSIRRMEFELLKPEQPSTYGRRARMRQRQ